MVVLWYFNVIEENVPQFWLTIMKTKWDFEHVGKRKKIILIMFVGYNLCAKYAKYVHQMPDFFFHPLSHINYCLSYLDTANQDYIICAFTYR
jgi:hypothetical protein